MKDEESRKNNIIVYGVPERKEQDGVKRREEEVKFILELLEGKMECKLTRNSLLKVTRLGQFDERVGKPRPLLVGFDSLSTKQEVLRNTKKLRGSEEYKDIRLHHDLTKPQREKMKMLVMEAKQLESADESGNFFISGEGSTKSNVNKENKEKQLINDTERKVARKTTSGNKIMVSS